MNVTGVDAAMTRALRAAGLDATIASTRDLSGGCIHRVLELTLGDGSTVVAKTNDASAAAAFEEERVGLQRLHETGTVLVPRPLGVHATASAAVLLMTRVDPGVATEDAWRRLGAELAELHDVDVGTRYGFDLDNHLGSTRQPNGWADDWIEFNRTRRLGHQIDLAEGRGLLRTDERRVLRRLVDRLHGVLPARPRPSLLHGDLWSGNALPSEGGRVALIDPACSIGDGWADVAMMRLFGGFPAACLEAYAQRVEDHERLEQRIAVYQLYHVLNHVNIFGRGYVGQAMSLAAAVG